MKKNKTIEILGNDISWYVESKSVQEMDESTQEHIKTLIEDGYTQGEVIMQYGKNNNKTTYGWWSIINWKDVALELYNAIKDIPTYNLNEKKKKAIKRFDENWNY